MGRVAPPGPAATGAGDASRIAAYDGLRGLAALVVVFTHANGAIEKSTDATLALLASPLAALLNATGAIHVFFVLSGVCLAPSALRGGRPSDLAQFYTRRVARIHAPFVFAVGMAWLATWLRGSSAPAAGHSEWIARQLGLQVPLEALWPSLLFPDTAAGLLPQGWTLRVEMIFSLLLPFMVMLAWRLHWGVLVALSAPLVAFEEPLFRSQLYALDFSAGIALYRERARLAALAARLPGAVRALLLCAGLVLLTLPVRWLLELSNPPLANALFALGAIALVAGARHAPGLAGFLSTAPLVYLGRISYSIYLLHFTLLTLLAPLLARPLGLAGGVGFALLVAAASTACAALAYAYVERPCIRAGNAACRWLARRLGGVARTSAIPARGRAPDA